jgi:hypothetical protein
MLSTDKCDYGLFLCGHSSPVGLPLKVRSHACRKTDLKGAGGLFICEKFNGQHMLYSNYKTGGGHEVQKIH